jgi:sRNA-binding carbon storage regulator CsrA
MLSLQRHVGEWIDLYAADGRKLASVEVIAIGRGLGGAAPHARLGFEAPQDVRIVRRELGNAQTFVRPVENAK